MSEISATTEANIDEVEQISLLTTYTTTFRVILHILDFQKKIPKIQPSPIINPPPLLPSQECMDKITFSF